MYTSKVMVVSTDHLHPLHLEHFSNMEDVIAYFVCGDRDGHIVHKYLMEVPQEPLTQALEHGGRRMPYLLTIQVKARELDCDYVLFDPEASRHARIPVWDRDQDPEE